MTKAGTHTDSERYVRRPDSVILSAAKELATGRIATVAFGAHLLSAGQMLHFVQHDKPHGDYFIRRMTSTSQAFFLIRIRRQEWVPCLRSHEHVFRDRWSMST